MICKNCGAKNPDWVYRCIKCNKVVFKKERSQSRKEQETYSSPVKSRQSEKKKAMSKDIEAAFALAKLECKEAIEPLNQLFSKNSSLYTRKNAAKALGQINDDFVVLPLILALKQIKNDKKIARAKHKKNEPSYTWHPGDEYSTDIYYWLEFENEWDDFENSIIESICRNKNKKTVKLLIQEYRNKNITKSAVSKTLIGIGQPAVNELLIALNDIDKSIRNMAKDMLSKIKSGPNANK